MKALQIKGYGDIESNLAFHDIDKPNITEHQVLVEVRAASVNPIDYKIIQGSMKRVKRMTFPAPIGFDVAGIVIKKGIHVKDLEIGDEVYSRVPSSSPGTFAEYVAVDANVVSLKPFNLDFIEAASLPLVALTTMQTFDQVNLKPEDKILIHAGSGGVGTFGIQYAKSKGAYVYTTTSTENVAWVKALGADRVIDYKTENYLDIAKDLDIVYDTLGGSYTEEAFEAIKDGGKVVSIAGIIDEDTAKKFGLNAIIRFILALKRKKITSKAQKKSALYKFILMQPDGELLAELKKLVEAGQIRPVIDKTFQFSETIDALLYIKSGRAKGKIIIKMEDWN